MTDILAELSGTSGLSCVYLSMLAVGVLYALVILVGGGLGEGGPEIADVHVGTDVHLGDALQGEVDLTHISPVTIAGFVTAFGAFGILAQNLFGVAGVASLLWASAGGLLVGVISHVAFYYFFIKPQGSSEVTARDVIGARGEVITPIPPGSVGEVAFEAQGARVTMGARAVDGSAIRRGAMVVIEDKVGSVALVRETAPREDAR